MALTFNGKLNATHFGLTLGEHNPYIKHLLKQTGGKVSKDYLQEAMLSIGSRQYGHSDISFMDMLEAVNCITQLLACYPKNPYYGVFHKLHELIKISIIVEAKIEEDPYYNFYVQVESHHVIQVATESYFHTHDEDDYDKADLEKWLVRNTFQYDLMDEKIKKAQRDLCIGHDVKSIATIVYEDGGEALTELLRKRDESYAPKAMPPPSRKRSHKRRKRS